ncbi:hypothetical protein B0T17DRAFT_518733 [Bombardia bombarda]|uniref:Uncharacterized protein n=1 Tax=Bombardia bombarda TaxID=252184 RepID=A0AA39XLL6_9PEZI|nr:hypothetical protein B0T17DRAFT_518733 [Bombardia bombarda]
MIGPALTTSKEPPTRRYRLAMIFSVRSSPAKLTHSWKQKVGLEGRPSLKYLLLVFARQR